MRSLPIPAHSSEIFSQIAPRFVATCLAQLFGIDFLMNKTGSMAKHILRDGRTHRATHTDPQLLLAVAS
jgi:hypothetical protein